MLVTELLTEVKDLVTDCNAKDAEILRIADRRLRALVRKQIQVDQGYYNCEISLTDDDFVEVSSEAHDFRLPSWHARVVEVRKRNANVTSGPLPYLSQNPDNLNDVLPYVTKDGLRHGWEYSGTDTFRVRGSRPDLDLRLRIAKIPARMGTFTLDMAFPDEQSFVLPQAFTLGTQEIGENFYMNTRFQIVEAAAGAAGGPLGPRKVLGSVRIGVGSDPNWIDTASGTRKTRVIVDRAWPVPLAIGDKIETVVELPDEHTDLLVLLIAERLFQKRNNTDALRSIADDMAREMQNFAAAISPRQNQQPIVAKRSLTGNRLYDDDPDKLPHFRRWR